MMLFKSWGYMTCSHGLNFISDMKIGHYMKIPPRSMFAAQAFAVIWLSLVQVATYNFAIGHINGICEDDQPQGLICPGAATFYNASVIWGVIVSCDVACLRAKKKQSSSDSPTSPLHRALGASLALAESTPGQTAFGSSARRAQSCSIFSRDATLVRLLNMSYGL